MVDLDDFPLSQSILRDMFLGSKLLEQEEKPSSVDAAVRRVIRSHMEGGMTVPESVIDLIVGYPELEELSEIVRGRWDVNVAALSREFDRALQLGEIVYERAVDAGIEAWLLRDIAVDLRNIEVERYHTEGSWFDSSKSKWQQRVMEAERAFYYPIMDRKIGKALDLLMDESFKADTDSPDTVRFGTSIEQSLGALSSALTFAVLFGSLTYMNLLRDKVGYLLFQFGRRSESGKMMIAASKTLLVGSRFDDVRRIFRSQWSAIYPVLVDDVAALVQWPMKHASYLTNRTAKCLMIELLGAYLSLGELAKEEVFLMKAIDEPLRMSTQLDVKRAALRALRVVMPRFDVDKHVANLTSTVETNGLVLDEIIQVLRAINWDQVGDQTRSQALDWVDTHLNHFLDARAALYVSAAIEKQRDSRSDMFSRLVGTWMEEPETRPSLSLYLVLVAELLSLGQLESLLDHLLDQIEAEDKSRVKGSSISIGGTSKFYLVAECVRRAHAYDWNRLSSIYQSVLTNDYQTDQAKYESLDSLVLLATEGNFRFPPELVIWIRDMLAKPVDIITRFREAFLLGGDYEKKAHLALRDLEILFAPRPDWSEVLETWVEFSEDSTPAVKRRVIRMISRLLDTDRAYPQDRINQLLYTKTFDPWPQVRGDAIVALGASASEHTDWIGLAVKRVKKLALDPEPFVRSSIVHVGGKWLSHDVAGKEARVLLGELSLDPHYLVRQRATALLESQSMEAGE